MDKNTRAGIGVMGALIVLMGVTFTLQGLGVIQSRSAMTGETLWVIIGPIMAILGVVLVVGAVRARRSR